MHFWSPAPDPLNQKLWVQSSVSVLVSPLGDWGEHSSLEGLTSMWVGGRGAGGQGGGNLRQ